MASRLFALRPIGLRTAEIESFRSWVRRIAYEHVVPVPTLLCRLVAPKSWCGTSQFSETVNGRSGRTELLLERLVALTEVPEVRQTTLAPLASIFSLRAVFRRKRAWCRLCLRGAEVCYDRLAWALKDVEACFVHGCLLDDRCGRCGKPHKPWHQRATPAYCPHCGNRLCMGDTAPADETRIRRARVVADLLGNMQSLELSADAVRAGFGQLVKLHGTIRAAAALLGLHERVLGDIVGDGRRMGFSTFLTGVLVAGGDVRTFLACREIPQRRRGDWNPRRSRVRPRPRIAEIGEHLRAALAQPADSRPSLTAICRALRVTWSLMRNNFPVETKQLLEEARQVRAGRRREREAKQSRILEEIERVVLDLVAEGRRPATEVVQERLGRRGLLLDPLYWRAWQRAVAAHDAGQSGGSMESAIAKPAMGNESVRERREDVAWALRLSRSCSG